VHGLDRSAAIATLERAHLHPVVAADGAYSDDVDAGHVVAQRPGEGARVTHGQTVTLTLSLGPQLFAVPSITPGTSTQDAARQLAAVTLVPAHGSDVYSDSVPKGAVVSTDPPAGRQLRKGSTVRLALSRGPQPVPLPAVEGKAPQDIAAQLRALHLTVARKVESSETVDQGEVTRLDPPSGTPVLPGAVVDMYVSSGPPFVTLPDVVGQDIEQAKADLERLGFQVKAYSLFGSTVQGMRPDPGSYRKGSTVELVAY
jgi:serine/threonine-protein kinase